MISIELPDLKPTIKLLQSMDSKLRNKVARKASRDSVKQALRIEKKALPKRTGTLRKSLKVRSIKSRRLIGHKITVAGTQGFYLPFLELGTKKITARHYVERALRPNQQLIFKRYIDSAREAFDKEVKK